MNLRRQRRESGGLRINLTPLIDTIFLLLVFFMMTTTFNRQSQLQINLPEAKGEQAVEEKKTIRIVVSAEGEYALDEDKKLIDNRLETLEAALKQQAGDNPEPLLLISADGKAPHYAVIKAMEAARNLGFVRLSFEAQQPADTK